MEVKRYICDICKFEVKPKVWGEDWLNPFQPSFKQYLDSTINEICKPCAQELAHYIDSKVKRNG